MVKKFKKKTFLHVLHDDYGRHMPNECSLVFLNMVVEYNSSNLCSN